MVNGRVFRYLGATALTIASSRGQVAIMKLLLDMNEESEASADNVDLTLTPLMAAALHSQDSACRLLLSASVASLVRFLASPSVHSFSFASFQRRQLECVYRSDRS